MKSYRLLMTTHTGALRVSYHVDDSGCLLVTPVGLEGSETKEVPPFALESEQTDSTERKSVAFNLQSTGAACTRHFPGLSDPAVRAKLATNLGGLVQVGTHVESAWFQRL